MLGAGCLLGGWGLSVVWLLDRLSGGMAAGVLFPGVPTFQPSGRPPTGGAARSAVGVGHLTFLGRDLALAFLNAFLVPVTLTTIFLPLSDREIRSFLPVAPRIAFFPTNHW